MLGLEVGDAHIIRSVPLSRSSARALCEADDVFAQERRRQGGRRAQELDRLAGRCVLLLLVLLCCVESSSLTSTRTSCSSADARDHRHPPRVRPRPSRPRASARASTGLTALLLVRRDCGYSHASTLVIQKALKARTEPAAHPFVDQVSLQEFKDPRESVAEDVAFLREHPLVHPDSKDKISGWVYQVSNGEMKRVC